MLGRQKKTNKDEKVSTGEEGLKPDAANHFMEYVGQLQGTK